MAVLAALAAATSVSRYVFDRDDVITGSFTNLYFTHNGDGRTVIMEESGSGYTGYLALTAYNYDGDNISARDISYSVRLPSDAELDAGEVVDAWGTAIRLDNVAIAEATRRYSVQFDPVKESSTIAAAGSEDNLMRNENTDIVKIERGGGASAGSLTFEGESIYVIIDIISPYRELRAFVVNTSSSLISVATSLIDTADTHFGYPQYSVYVQTARHFENAVPNVNLTSPVKVQLTWTSGSPVIFDDGRLISETNGNLVQGEVPADNAKWSGLWSASSASGSTTVTLFLEQGSEVSLYFYVTDPSAFSCTVKAWFQSYDGGSYAAQSYTYIAGAAEDGTVLEIGA